MDYSNIPTGLKIPSQIPLDIKGYVLNEATLAYLGVDDNLAFTYHDGLRVVCIEEKTIYEWREVQSGEENTGLIPVDFTYPSNLPETYGINYSDRTFNFFQITPINTETVTQLLEDYVLNINLPDYQIKEIGFSNSLVSSFSLYDGEENFENITKFKLKNISIGSNTSSTAINLFEQSHVDPLTDETKKNISISFQPFLEETEYTKITGNASFTEPLKVELKNPQKIVNDFPYQLLPEDDKYTLFINNSVNDVEIRIPDDLPNNFLCSFVQKGTGIVTIVGIDLTNLLYPNTSLTNEIKGQYFACMIEKELDTVNYYLIGNLKPL